jgi:hypothetical protein
MSKSQLIKETTKEMSKETTKDSQKEELSNKFQKYIETYLSTYTRFSENVYPEFEIRFGTKKIKNINKVDFYNVIKSLLNYDFKLINENYFLKIMNASNLSNIRTQINGMPNIQSYCKFNNLSGILDENNIKFVEKEYFKNNDTQLFPLDFDDYNFRVCYQTEQNYPRNHNAIEELHSKWNSFKKIFRYIKRYEYRHPDLPFLIHCSIVKTSKSQYGKFIEQFNIKDSEVFNSLENFEIEIELNNELIIANKTFSSAEFLYTNLRKVIKYILIGLQETNYPITLNEMDFAMQQYLKLAKGPDYKAMMLPNIKDFIGPSSTTLQMVNILPETEINDTNNSIPNIRNNYTVTDKADGTRKLLYISPQGKLYFVSTTMNIQFIGCYSEKKELFNTIIDGEHILHNKKGEYINVFACFDIYYFNGKNVTGLPFINLTIEEQSTQEKETSKKEIQETTTQETSTQEKSAQEKSAQEKSEKSKKEENFNYRLIILNSVIKSLELKSITNSKEIHIKINVKKFYGAHIFNGCTKILSNINEGLYEYNTDGLIFTPANTGVCSSKTGVAAPNYKTTWNESFKWKPPHYNTIDFLIKFKKNELGGNYIGTLNNEGEDLTSYNQVKSYYTLILNVGFDEKKHGYINPYNDIINNNIKRDTKESYTNSYKPCRFYPTNPNDVNAGLCNIMGKLDESNNLKIYTLEGDEIEDNTIVEFAYNSNNPEFWRWEPLRVRSDKTSELRSGVKNFGNAYHTANSNWQSIHNPISESILMTGNGVTVNNDDDVYYNKISKTSETQALRDFHNLYVKSMLINKVSKSGYSLIDYAVGKGGDLPKWISANLNFVLGLDLSKDNIENRLDGVCARYLNYAQRYAIIPKALFLHGNSSHNIKDGSALYDDKSRQIIKALFGEGTKNEVLLGKGVYNNYGIVKNGFNISSIQFAMHYMFESENVLNEFIKNITQCTALEGYFIGTCYDGSKIFNMLNSLNIDESISLFKNEKKIWELTKKYDAKEFNDDESSLGYAINVYQETINKTFKEYLVNFKYLLRIMENNGFVLLNETEYKQLNLPGSMGNFEHLYNFMTNELKSNNYLLKKIGNSAQLSTEEKQISFLNNYFIFKKIRNVEYDPEKLVSKKQELKEKELQNEIIGEFKKIDEEFEIKEKEKLDEKSKKLASKYLKEAQDLEQQLEEQLEEQQQSKATESKAVNKTKLSIDEKIKLAEEKKKAKEEEKLKAAQEKKAAKEAEKSLKAETKKSQKTQTKKAQ